jgi:hypothetical protein
VAFLINKIMNREIKFKAWHESEKVMVGPYGITDAFWQVTKHHKLLFLQFSGLKDKNGKEIYEGDIITYDLKEGLGEPARIGLQSEVKYSPFGFFGAWDTNIKVIGNIYENPDLLTK